VHAVKKAFCGLTIAEYQICVSYLEEIDSFPLIGMKSRCKSWRGEKRKKIINKNRFTIFPEDNVLCTCAVVH